MRDKFIRFMSGRYGVDILGRDLLILSIIIMVINLFVKSNLLGLVPSLISFYVIFRTMSKNYPKRYNENRVYALFRQRMKTNTLDRKKFRYFTCKNCKQKVRVPKGRGKITITCPRCNHKFDKKT